jgi:hypothetical protein
MALHDAPAQPPLYGDHARQAARRARRQQAGPCQARRGEKRALERATVGTMRWADASQRIRGFLLVEPTAWSPTSRRRNAMPTAPRSPASVPPAPRPQGRVSSPCGAPATEAARQDSCFPRASGSAGRHSAAGRGAGPPAPSRAARPRRSGRPLRLGREPAPAPPRHGLRRLPGRRDCPTIAPRRGEHPRFRAYSDRRSGLFSRSPENPLMPARL